MLRLLDKCYNGFEEARTRCCGHLDDEPVGNHVRAADDRRALFAIVPNDRGRLAGYRRLVDGSHTRNHHTVGGDGFIRLDQNQVARNQQVACHQFVATAIAHAGSGKTFRDGLLPGWAQGIQPCRAASSAESLPEHGQEYQHPQAGSSNSSKRRIRNRRGGKTNDSEQRRRNRQQLERKYNWVVDRCRRVEPFERGCHGPARRSKPKHCMRVQIKRRHRSNTETRDHGQIHVAFVCAKASTNGFMSRSSCRMWDCMGPPRKSQKRSHRHPARCRSRRGTFPTAPRSSGRDGCPCGRQSAAHSP